MSLIKPLELLTPQFLYPQSDYDYAVVLSHNLLLGMVSLSDGHFAISLCMTRDLRSLLCIYTVKERD